MCFGDVRQLRIFGELGILGGDQGKGLMYVELRLINDVLLEDLGLLL